MRPKLVDNATWMRKAGSLLRFAARAAAEAPPRAVSDDPRATLLAELEDEQTTRVVWHATDGGGVDAPIHEWQACAVNAQNCGREWPHGSGFYLVYHEDDPEVPSFATHYRASGDREDPRPSSGRQDPDAEYRRTQAEFWGRIRSEAADKQEEVKRLRDDLAAAHQACATHLETIASRDARIAALEQDRVPSEHWASPIVEQIGGFLNEIKPYAGPAIRDAAPFVRAAVQEHLSAGAYSVGLLDRLERACGAFDRLLADVAAVADLPSGFGLRIPEPTDAAVLAHHCPLGPCAAEAGEPCLDDAGHPTDHHEERRTLARVPREARSALKKHKIEIVPLSAIVSLPGSIVAADEGVLKSARELEGALEMDAWRARQQPDPAALAPETQEPTPPAPTPEATAPVVTPPPAPIPDAEIEEVDPASRAQIKLDTPESRAEYAARAAERESPETAERAAGIAKAKGAIRERIAEMEARRAEIEAARAAAKNEDPQ